MLLKLKGSFFRLGEWVCEIIRYYPNFSFVRTDLLLGMHYLWRNAHQVSAGVQIYGETPLTTLDKIARRFRILSSDVVYELGSGPGRTVFWLHHFVKCEAVGIELQETFTRRANRVKRWRGLSKVTFVQGDMLAVSLSRASVVYLYGTCFDDEMIHKLIEKFQRLPRSTRIITVSYSLAEYSPAYVVKEKFLARFPWGRSEVYLNQRL